MAQVLLESRLFPKGKVSHSSCFPRIWVAVVLLNEDGTENTVIWFGMSKSE
jgi:hypothetical protein